MLKLNFFSTHTHIPTFQTVVVGCGTMVKKSLKVSFPGSFFLSMLHKLFSLVTY